jgi:hypothetical protein
LNMVQRVHPFQFTNGTRPWNDANNDRLPQDSELGAFAGFPGLTSRYGTANGPDWPYSDEFTAGVEHQLMRDFRMGLMYYHRTNRKQIGSRNAAVPLSAYTEHTIAVPGAPTGPGGMATFYNLSSAFVGQAFQDNVFDNESLLDTTYDGVELTAVKRLSRWQVMAGLTVGRNHGGVATGDLNDPNNALIFPEGIEGTDSKYAFRVSGSYTAPGDVNVSGSFILNDGYPYVSAYNVTRTIFPALTRSSQTARLTERGDERLPDVAMVDLRVSRTFRIGDRRVTPLVEVFNVGNADTVVGYSSTVGAAYLRPSDILSPRIVRAGITVDF